MKGFTLYGKGKCPLCGRIIGGWVPAGTDGSVVALMYHHRPRVSRPWGKPCGGQGVWVKWTIRPGKHCRGEES